MAEILRLEGVNLDNAEGRSIFQALEWSLEAGARARIHGAPGAGCSALLRLCAGLADPDDGRVILDGIPFSAYAFSHPFLKKGGLGWVPMEGGLLVNLSLCANVALPLRFLRGHSKPQAETTALEMLEAVGLAHRAQARPHVLEPRERWLGALARAAAVEPDLWLLDQPPSLLDSQDRARAGQLLRKAAAKPECSFVMVGQADGGVVDALDFRIENGRMVGGGLS